MSNISKDVAVLEIRNKTFKLFVGFLFNERVYCLYRNTFPLTCKLNDANITNKEILIKDLLKITHIDDVEHNLKLNIKDVILVYPSYGLEVYCSEKTTNTVSPISKVAQIDVDNVISLFKKEKVPNPNSKIVEILPNEFLIDGDRHFVLPPIGETSSFISLHANVYVLPTEMVDDYKECVKSSNINVSKEVIAPIGLSYYLEKKGFQTSTYCLVDCGYKSTIVSLVGKNKVYSSTYFNFGFDSLINSVMEKFEVSYDEAKDLLDKFGFDLNIRRYDPAIVKKDRGEGAFIEFKREDLNTIIDGFANSFSNFLLNSLNILLANTKSLLNNIPLYFYGETLNIRGIKDCFRKYVSDYKIDFLLGNVIGADDGDYLNCISALYYSSFYKGSIDDINLNKKITTIKREENTNEEYDETKDEL